jgi:glycine/D-amino acid oxidase-like deaminating enzyme
LTPGNLLLSDFSQYWISVTSDRKLRAGGARYLRKWAGVEAIEAHLDEKITSTVKKRIESLFDVKLSNPTLQHALLELRACDEIPIIGPMYDDSRVLMAGGYMGSGLTLGCAAGRGLSEFIIEGRSKTVPAIFHPKRLRSLAE